MKAGGNTDIGLTCKEEKKQYLQRLTENQQLVSQKANAVKDDMNGKN
jgi:hypothetical protein